MRPSSGDPGMSTPRHSVSVTGVAFDDAGRVLLIRRRDDGRWQAPGGVLELAETFEEGVVREVREETGIDLVVEGLTGVYKNLARGVVALVFRCRAVAGVPTTTDEAADVAWVDLDDALPRMSPAFAARVSDAASWTVPIPVRAHDGTNLL